MAECRSCGKQIPEGSMYCNECEARMKADESYLDSLLSSVVANSAEPAPERPVRKTTAEPVATAFSAKEEELQDSFVIEELNEPYTEVEEPEYEPLATEVEEAEYEPFATEVEEAEYEPLATEVEESENEPFEDVYNIFDDTDDSFLDDMFAEDVAEAAAFETSKADQEEELLADLLRTVDGEDYEIDLNGLHEDAAAYSDEQFMAVETEPEAFADEGAAEPASVQASVFDSYVEEPDAEATRLGEALAEEVFATDDDLFGMLTAEEDAPAIDEDPFAMFSFAEEQNDATDSGNQSSADDDMMDIWGLMSSDTEESADTGRQAGFEEFPELFDMEDEYLSVPKMASDGNENVKEPVQEKKKKNIFARIFGNIREDLTEEEIEERKRLALEKFEEDEQKAADEAAREKLNKEEKAKRKEEEAAQKQEEKELLARKKAEEKRAKAEQKRLQKDKREQAKRALLAEIEENEGKINKFGASIIIVMFAAMLCLIMFGTSYYNYKISIDKAQFDFDLQRYDDAYNDVYGLEIKEEDMELYDKIMTVQYVNVQLLSYMRYNSLDMDAEALDSLMKGLRRYEKFIQHGTELGIMEDLNYLKKEIVEQLNSVYGIDEETAYAMLEAETQEEYSMQVYDAVSKKN